jgi:hypothetical protein
LQPLVRMLIRNGVTFPEFSRSVKDIFIEECIKDGLASDRALSAGRVSILAGIPREEVNRVVREWSEADGDTERHRVTRILRVLSDWSTDERYVGPYGWPLDIPFDNPDKDGVSFSALVRRLRRGISAATMLDELLRVGAVRRLESGIIRLENRAYILEAQSNASLTQLSAVVSNVLQTVSYNLDVDREEDRWFQRTVLADNGLSAEHLPYLAEFLKDRGSQFLEAIDAWMAARHPAAEEQRLNVGVGVYMFVQDEKDTWDPIEHPKFRFHAGRSDSERTTESA